MADASKRQMKKTADLNRILHKEQQKAKIKQIRKILKKKPWERSSEEVDELQQCSEIVEEIQSRMKKRLCMEERLKEVEDNTEVLAQKCWQLAQAIKEAQSLIIYTGAGISTAAEIPDYRGPTGIWTLLQQGKSVRVQDLSSADPTYTHMAITTLYREGCLKHVVSQNCDGLHLRSGLPCNVLSEVHGNMYIEVCPKCKPLRQFVRLFDVTENTSLHRHKTQRHCHRCKEQLQDTIVHFGERGRLRWPLNWEGAVKAINKCDMILCLGSSLKVLRRYPCLWAKDRPCSVRPKLYIVNLQWTPKDDQSTLKLNGKCDVVMNMVMNFLGLTVPVYNRCDDPIFTMAVPLKPGEENTITRKQLTDIIVDKPETTDSNAFSELKNSSHTISMLSSDHCYARENVYYMPDNKDTVPVIKSDNVSSENLEEKSPNRSFLSASEPAKSGLDFYEDSCDSFSADKCTDYQKSDEILLNVTNLEQCEELKSEKEEEEEEEKEEEAEEEREAVEDIHDIGLTGWYGKGQRKWRKARRRKL